VRWLFSRSRWSRTWVWPWSRKKQGGEYNSNNCVECQLCGKKGHTVQKCFKRFDRSFTGEDKVAYVATSSYEVDTNWYADSGATDHITGDL
jgi:hypothetical protein